MRLALGISQRLAALSASGPSNRLTAARHLAETFAIGAAGGLTLGLAGMPAGYLSGAILTVAAAALGGRPMLVPVPLARVIFVLIGISLGAVVTPETLHGMATYPLSIAVLMVAMICVCFACAIYLRVVHGWKTVEAYLASGPGAMSQMLALGAELGADLRAIAIVQSVRVTIIAVGLPAGLSLLGLVGHATRPGPGPLTLAALDELAILIIVASLGAAVAYRLRLPGGLLFGAMLTSAALHGTGFIHAVLPWWLINTAAIALGAVIGARFTNTPLRLLLDFVGAAFGSFAVSVAIVAVFAAGLIGFLSLRVAEVMIAFAPGSVDAMMLLALALHLDPVYVGAHHIMRIFLVALSMPLIVRRAARKAVPPVAPKPPLRKRPPPFED